MRVTALGRSGPVAFHRSAPRRRSRTSVGGPSGGGPVRPYSHKNWTKSRGPFRGKIPQPRLSGGRTLQDLGRSLNWGTKDQADARIGELSREDLSREGWTEDDLIAARDWYAAQVARHPEGATSPEDPGNPAAPSRVRLLDHLIGVSFAGSRREVGVVKAGQAHHAARAAEDRRPSLHPAKI